MPWRCRAVDYDDLEAFNAAVNAVLLPYSVDLVVLAGFLSLYRPPPDLAERVMKHPPGASAVVWRPGVLRRPGAPGGARVGGEGERLHRSLR